MTCAWFDVTRDAGIARIMHMSYRSKTYTWNDVILIKRSMIWGLFIYLLIYLQFIFYFVMLPVAQTI